MLSNATNQPKSTVELRTQSNLILPKQFWQKRARLNSDTEKNRNRHVVDQVQHILVHRTRKSDRKSSARFFCLVLPVWYCTSGALVLSLFT